MPCWISAFGCRVAACHGRARANPQRRRLSTNGGDAGCWDLPGAAFVVARLGASPASTSSGIDLAAVAAAVSRATRPLLDAVREKSTPASG